MFGVAGESAGGGLGGTIIFGIIVGWIAVRVVRYRPGRFGSTAVGVVSMLVGRFAVTQLSLGRAMTLVLTIGVAIVLAILALHLLRYVAQNRNG